MHKLYMLLIGVHLFFSGGSCLADEFPYRKDYPNVPVIELADLKSAYDQNNVIVVDVRSEVEYEAIHPKKSVHIPFSSRNFLLELQSLAETNPDKKIAVYCNGITCLKSYHAAQQAMDAGLTNVYAFDAGIPAWTDRYPSETLLVGKEITDPEKQLISREELKKRSIDFETFKIKGQETNSLIIDARDPIQRTHNLPGMENAMPIPLDKLIKNIVFKGRMKDKQLLIFDQVGKQINWLMYYLIDQDYTSYYFLDGGATSVLKEQEYR